MGSRLMPLKLSRLAQTCNEVDEDLEDREKLGKQQNKAKRF